MVNETQENRDAPAPGEPVEIATVVITPIQDGPLHVKGSCDLSPGTGDAPQRVSEIWLCRCGGSAKKPFCDGTHKRNGFRAEGRAPIRK